MGTRTPWRTRAWMLFCVTTRGRDRIFSNPRDSSMERMASSRTEELAFRKEKPLVGPVAPKFENKGICTPVLPVGRLVPIIGYLGTMPKVEVGDVPTAEAPPTEVALLPQPNPS